MNVAPTIDSLLQTLSQRAPAATFSWLRGILDAEAFDDTAFFNAYAASGRRFGTLANDARTCLLVHACTRLPSDQHAALVTEVFRKGDNRERVALLQTLHALPQPERFLETAIEACRTHVQDVFEAIACDNPYPAAHFPDLNFQQLVMKALFTQAPLERVHAWTSRVTEELQRMARDFAAERAAAGREVPSDVSLIVQAPTTPSAPGGIA